MADIDEDAMAENADDFMMHVLHAIYVALESRARPEVACAVLCKRFNVRMSSLQRHLTVLEEHGLVNMQCDEAGRWTTNLTEQGFALFELPENLPS
jgi:DNA-binding MarR family transcriptional regulator